jgi:hypothetical protein
MRLEITSKDAKTKRTWIYSCGFSKLSGFTYFKDEVVLNEWQNVL